MKSKKLLLPSVILAIAVFAIAITSVFFGIAKKPVITEGEFPFSVTYELNGKTKTVENVYYASYEGNGGYADTKERIYEGRLGNSDDDVNDITLQETADGRIALYLNFFPDYMMGDVEPGDYEDLGFLPQLLFYDQEGNEFSDEETLLAHGAKIVDWEYPTPLENSFVFSHFSILSGEIVIPVLAIALLALLATFIFVKKEEGWERKPIDLVSMVFNFIVGIFTLPYFTAATMLLDIAGDNDNVVNQLLYFTAPLTVLGIAASVALRRKGYGKSALVVQFAGPAFFVLLLVLDTVLGAL